MGEGGEGGGEENISGKAGGGIRSAGRAAHRWKTPASTADGITSSHCFPPTITQVKVDRSCARLEPQ